MPNLLYMILLKDS